MPPQPSHRQGSILGTHVGRRLIALFLGCALLPLVGFGWLALTQVSDSLRAEVERTLHGSAKDGGMELARRLLEGADELALGAEFCRHQGQSLRSAPQLVRDRLAQTFVSIQRAEGDALIPDLGSVRPFPPLTEAETRHLTNNRRLARVRHDRKDPAITIVLRIHPQRPDSALLVGELRHDRLFDLEALRGAGTEVIVLAADADVGVRTVLASSLPQVPDLAPMQDLLGQHSAAATFTWDIRGESHVARYWRVFLRPQLGLDWFIVQSRSQRVVEEPLNGFRQTLLATAALTLLLVVSTSLAQIRRTIVPIRQLVGATQRVAQGDLEARAAIRGDDEFAQLGRSFDEMTGQLAANIRRRELTEIDLIAARDAALAAVHAKAAFLTNVSHELRTPLTAIVGAAEILRDFGDDDPQARAEFLEIMVGQAERLQRLIEGVLELQNEARSPFCPTEIHANLAEALAGLPAATVERVDLESEDGLPLVAAAPTRLLTVWRQLVDNAAKFSPPTSRISVRAHRRGDQVLVDVTDRGVGIDPADQDRIFEPFCQIGDLLTAKSSGIGLGLTLVRSIVAAHAGRITVTSQRGVGSTFRVALPIHTAAPNTIAAANVLADASA